MQIERSSPVRGLLRSIAIGCLFGSLASLLTGRAGASQVALAVNDQPALVRARQTELLARKGLAAAADVTGSYTATIAVELVDPSDLGELVKLSGVIIEGRVQRSSSTLTTGGRSIATAFTVQTGVALKGGVTKDEALQILIPGGAVRFSNGSVAIIIARGVAQPQVGHSYLWFLREQVSSPAVVQDDIRGPRRFVPVSLQSGVLEVAAGGKIRPSGISRSLLSHRVFRERYTRDDFLDRIRQEINRK